MSVMKTRMLKRMNNYRVRNKNIERNLGVNQVMIKWERIVEEGLVMCMRG